MKRREEAFQTLYVVEVKDRMRDPWRVKSAHERRGDAEDAACRTLMIGRVDDLRITKWARKEAAE